jgi:formamidopyrimidine-DNA glycosylase
MYPQSTRVPSAERRDDEPKHTGALTHCAIVGHIVSGVGNAYSDEILHAARLSPLALTRKLTRDEWNRLFAAARGTLELWLGRLRAAARERFPEKVTAFREGMAVHGRYGKPYPRCGAEILRMPLHGEVLVEQQFHRATRLPSLAANS